MKYLTIVMLLLLINVAASIINVLNTSDPLFYYSVQAYEEAYEPLKKEDAQIQDYLQNAATTNTNLLTFGDYLFAFAKFVGLVAFGVVIVPYTLIKMGIPTLIALFISVPVYFLYFIGIYQFIANRAGKSMY